jgi:hypothetical protein
VASFDRSILPGGEGNITLRINTKGYREAINLGAKVYTNDPRIRISMLSVKAFVKVAIHVSPRTVNIFGTEGQTITQVVEIRAGLDRPLKLIPTRFDLEGKLTYTVDEIEKGQRFSVRFTAISGPPGSYRGSLVFNTNYPENPEITIWIIGRFTKKE